MKITAYYVDSGGQSYGPMSGRASSAKYHREARAGNGPKIRSYEYQIEPGTNVLFFSDPKWVTVQLVAVKPMTVSLHGTTFGVEPWNLKPLKAAHE